jgi:Mn2+/Fe2+ NRAMP family transporter
VLLLLAANTINLAADLGAMGAALKLVLGGPALAYTAGFALLSLLLQATLPFERYAPMLKFLTLSLLAYAAVAFVVNVPWGEVGHALVMPRVRLERELPGRGGGGARHHDQPVPVLLAGLARAGGAARDRRAQAAQTRARAGAGRVRAACASTPCSACCSRTRSAFFVMLTAAVVLHSAGVTEINSTEDAARALEPLAGKLAFALFTLGIVGTGLLAVPILSASAAYALADVFRWKTGLSREPKDARPFYAVIALATLGGLALNFTGHRPHARALLGRRRERRHRRADHGRDPARRVRQETHGQVRRAAAACASPAGPRRWLMALAVVAMFWSLG